MIDINDYKFYIRDVGITNEDLTKVINDVISDIALSTKIFKKAFGFTIEPSIDTYDFRSIMAISERTQYDKIESLTLQNYTEQQLIDFLSDPTNMNVDVDKETYTTNPILNTYIDTIDVLSIKDNELMSVFNMFEPVNGETFKFVGSIEEPVSCVAIVRIIPNIDNIEEETEVLLKSAIVEGLKYYTDTRNNAQSVGSETNRYKIYENAKLALQNKFPTYVGQQMKRSIV